MELTQIDIEGHLNVSELAWTVCFEHEEVR